MPPGEPSDPRRIFRDANEKIERERLRLALGDGPAPYICECATVRCTALVLVPPEVYARAREGGATRLVVPGHEHGDEVVEASATHSIVRERDGRAE